MISDRVHRRALNAPTADAMVDLGSLTPANYIQIDDCWQARIVIRTPAQSCPTRSVFRRAWGPSPSTCRAKASLGLYGDIGTKTCGGFVGFNVSATPGQRLTNVSLRMP